WCSTRRTRSPHSFGPSRDGSSGCSRALIRTSAGHPPRFSAIGSTACTWVASNISVVDLKPVPRTLLRERAYEAIRDVIVRGDLEPGTPVRDIDLAAQLGLSRAPVRDALARLANEGLVEMKPQSYT